MAMQPVRGTHDLLPEECEKFRLIVDRARRVALRFGFREMATPIFESTEVFHRTLGESTDIISKETYTFPDRGGDSITLRPEGTAGIARAFISEGLAQLAPLKFFYHGPMFRYERPQKGRQRQFHQIGVELIGVPSVQADLECIALAQMTLAELGLGSSTQLHLNSLGDSESRKAYREALVKFLKGVESKLSEDSKKRLSINPMRVLDSKDSNDQALLKNAPRLGEFLNEASKATFTELKSRLKDLEVAFIEDPFLVRGLDYYSHSVFEFKSSSLGAQDTVLAGGRYDGLIELMGGPQTPGVGWAAGLERLSLIANLKLDETRPVALIPLGEAAEVFALKLAQKLRQAGFATEMAYGGNLSKRMKKANNAKALAALIIGDDELKKNTAQLKNLDSGTQSEVRFSDLEKTLNELHVSKPV